MPIAATIEAVREHLRLMGHAHPGGNGGSELASELHPVHRAAVGVSGLGYSVVGLAYWRAARDPVGAALFAAVGVGSAAADADVLAGTRFDRHSGTAHVADRWLATVGGVYFVIPRFFSALRRGPSRVDLAALAALPVSLFCLRTARRQHTGDGWANWQTAWHVVSSAVMVAHIVWAPSSAPIRFAAWRGGA